MYELDAFCPSFSDPQISISQSSKPHLHSFDHHASNLLSSPSCLTRLLLSFCAFVHSTYIFYFPLLYSASSTSRSSLRQTQFSSSQFCHGLHTAVFCCTDNSLVSVDTFQPSLLRSSSLSSPRWYQLHQSLSSVLVLVSPLYESKPQSCFLAPFCDILYFKSRPGVILHSIQHSWMNNHLMNLPLNVWMYPLVA